MTGGGDVPQDTRLRRAARRELTVFLLSGVLALVAVSWGTVVLGGQVARQDALGDAERSTRRLADFVVAPLLVDVLTGRPGATEDLDRVVANRMADGVLHQLLVWAPDGVVVWSSDPTLTGQTHEVTPELRSTLAGESSAELSWERELGAPDELVTPTELEVYAPIEGPDGGPLVFEAYYAAEGLDRSTVELRARIVPVAVGGLVLLQLVQVPIALRMSRRTSRQARDRSRLLARTLSASERERSQLAGQLHDGPVQDLAGLGYGLGALELQVADAQRPAVTRLSGVLDTAVLRLRRLMVEVYPPELGGAGLGWALEDLTTPLREAGVRVDCVLADPGDVDPETAATVYRAARETLSNSLRHSGAGQVRVELAALTRDGVAGVRLAVLDDGIGLPPTGIDKRAQGHLGLRLLVDRAADLGGRMTAGPGAVGGTAVELWLPAHLPGA